jgi:serine/threonine-protein kinase
MLHHDTAADPELRAATWREARAAARLAHPHIAQIHDYAETAVGGVTVAYLVMELLEGQSLAEILAHGSLPWREAVEVGAHTAAAVAAAHAAGIVHGDIKPANVMLTPAGVKVFDFGVALHAGAGSQDRGRLAGTPAYAAPEYVAGAVASDASDVYALGLLMYESLTGHPLISAATWPEARRRHVAGIEIPPLDVPGLPRSASRLCRACLAADPADRPPAADVAAGLAAVAGQPAVAQRAAAVAQAPRPVGGLGHPTLPAFPAGSARVPSPPTMIDNPPDLRVASHPHAIRTAPRGLVLGLAAVILLLAVTVGAIIGSSLSDRPSGNSAAQSPTTQLVAPTITTPAATGPAALLDQVDFVIATALSTGQLDPDAADTLRERLTRVADAIDSPQQTRKAAREFVKTTQELADDNKMDQSVADQLTGMVNSLIEA